MATYIELINIRTQPGFGDFRDRIAFSVAVKAVALLQQAVPAPITVEYQNQVAWAKNAIARPIDVAEELIFYVIADASTASVAAILGATDNVIKDKVSLAVDAILAGTVV